VSESATTAGIVAILVVDQVGSTHFFVTHGEAEATRVTSEHGEAMRRIVQALGGSVEASTGDGYIASFGLATAALDAAVEIQRAAQRLSRGYPEPVEVRIGLAIGEVHHDGADLRGWPFFHASRLCDAAPNGAILASRTLLDVVATRTEHILGEVHHLRLKGLDEPSEAVEIEWERSGDAGQVVLNPELAVLEQRPWVGRAEPVATLLDAVTGSDPPRLVVVAGEPGAGKSRLIARFAAEATQSDHIVLYGVAPRDASSSHAPIVTALRSGFAALRPEVRSSVLAGSAGRELSRLLPDLGGPGREILHPLEGAGAQRLLLDGIGEALFRLAEQANGLTFVVDDLQWADDTALATVRYLAGPDGPPGVTVLGVIRSADVANLATLIADVGRRGDVLRLDLPGLPPADIAALVSEVQPALGQDQVSRTAELLAERTGGNALFVTSLLAHPDWLDADGPGDRSPLPAELSMAIAERLTSLEDDDIVTLTAASVIGQRFPARLLAEVVEQPPASIGSTVRRARQGGLLQDLGGGEVGFIHDLVRLALMPPDDSFELALLHRVIAEQLEQMPDPDITATATHFVEGVAAGADPDKAVEWSERAAHQSMRQLTYQQAARQFEQAIAILGADDARRHPLTVELGRAQLLGGDPAYRETLLDAVDQCLDAGEPALAAEAALSNNRGLYSAAGEVDDERIVALERVLDTDQEPSVRSKLTATLAVESVFGGAPPADLAELSQNAVDLARRSGDQAALAHALTLRQDSNYRIDNLADRLDETDELLELTVDGDLRARFWAVAHRATTVGEAGRWDEVEQMILEADAIASATRAPVLEWYAAVLGGAQAIQHGELREAQRIIDHGYDVGLGTGQPDALIPTSGQQCEVLRRRGRYETILALAEENLNADLLRRSAPMRAVLLLEDGQDDQARSLWESVGLEGALDVPAAQVGHNLLHARRLCQAFDDQDVLGVIEERLVGVPPFLFCNYWEPTAAG
jgi:class 3 adenylate cyclase